MRNRFLYVILSFLALFSSYAEFGAQKAVFSSSSDELKIIEIHSSSKEFISVSLTKPDMSGLTERTLSRSDKKSDTQGQFHYGFVVGQSSVSSVNLPFLSDISQSAFRVFLIPKSIKTILFLQTVI